MFPTTFQFEPMQLGVGRGKLSFPITFNLAFLPSLSWFSPRNLPTLAFSIWTTESTETRLIFSFHRHSLMAPVSSAIKALQTRAYSPKRVNTSAAFGISRTRALRLIRFIPHRKSPMRLVLSTLLRFESLLSQGEIVGSTM